MNITLVEEIYVDRNWLVLPWFNPFRWMKKEQKEHTKYALEKAINRVSNWAEYCIPDIDAIEMHNSFTWNQFH